MSSVRAGVAGAAPGGHIPAGQQAHWVPQGPLPAAPPPRDLPEGTSLFLNSLGRRCPSSFSKDNPGLFHSMCYRAGVGNDRWSREAVAGVICMVVAPHCPLAEDAFSGAVLPADAQSGRLTSVHRDSAWGCLRLTPYRQWCMAVTGRSSTCSSVEVGLISGVELVGCV